MTTAMLRYAIFSFMTNSKFRQIKDKELVRNVE